MTPNNRSSLTRPALLLGLLFLGAACDGGSGKESFEITYDPCAPTVIVPEAEATDAQRASVRDALVMWNDAASTQLTTRPTAGAVQIPVVFEDAAAAFYGMYQDEIGDVWINSRIESRFARAVTIAHELGHAFGLYHVEGGERSVMNPGNLEITPTEADALRLRDLWGPCEVPYEGP